MSETPPANQSPEKKPEATPPPADINTPFKVTEKPPVKPASSGVKPAKAIQPAKESGTRRFFRKVLYWVILVLVLFTAGVGVTWFVRVQPLEEEKAQAISAQATAEVKATQVQSQLSQALTDSGKLNSATAHMLLLHAMNDVNTARLNLAQSAAANAKNALTTTGETLSKLAVYADGQQKGLINPAVQRLTLVQGEIEKDPQTALSDLGILNDQLVGLEKKLFPGQ